MSNIPSNTSRRTGNWTSSTPSSQPDGQGSPNNLLEQAQPGQTAATQPVHAAQRVARSSLPSTPPIHLDYLSESEDEFEQPAKRQKVGDGHMAAGLSHGELETPPPLPSLTSPVGLPAFQASDPAQEVAMDLDPVAEEALVQAPLVAVAPQIAAGQHANGVDGAPVGQPNQFFDQLGNVLIFAEPAIEAVAQLVATFGDAFIDHHFDDEAFAEHQEIAANVRAALEGAGLVVPLAISTFQLVQLGLQHLQDPDFLGHDNDDQARRALKDTLNAFFTDIGIEVLDGPALAVLDQFGNNIPALTFSAAHVFAVTQAVMPNFPGPLLSFDQLVGLMDQVNDMLENDDSGQETAFEINLHELRDALLDLATIIGNIIVAVVPAEVAAAAAAPPQANVPRPGPTN